MEDKRTLLAFLFIGLILLAMPYYYDWMGLSPKPPVEEPAATADTVETAPGARAVPLQGDERREDKIGRTGIGWFSYRRHHRYAEE